MIRNDYILKFQDLDINELEKELENRQNLLFNLIEVERMDEVLEEIEVLKFLINEAENIG